MQAYPPRGIIRLLDPAQIEAGRPAIERFIADEYILDTLVAFDVDRSVDFEQYIESRFCLLLAKPSEQLHFA
jgi:hypothetical protein